MEIARSWPDNRTQELLGIDIAILQVPIAKQVPDASLVVHIPRNLESQWKRVAVPISRLSGVVSRLRSVVISPHSNSRRRSRSLDVNEGLPAYGQSKSRPSIS